MEIIIDGERHCVEFDDPAVTIESHVMVDGYDRGLKIKDCLGHPNPLFRTIFAIYLNEYRDQNAFGFCCVPPLEKVGGIWQ